jgi:hypothetical protein
MNQRIVIKPEGGNRMKTLYDYIDRLGDLNVRPGRTSLQLYSAAQGIFRDTERKRREKYPADPAAALYSTAAYLFRLGYYVGLRVGRDHRRGGAR